MSEFTQASYPNASEFGLPVLQILFETPGISIAPTPGGVTDVKLAIYLARS
jgi:hypothetical protein